jgi:hypothetical protein
MDAAASGFGAIVLAIRPILEDATLQHELSGYGEYALHIRYKWISGNLVTRTQLSLPL